MARVQVRKGKQNEFMEIMSGLINRVRRDQGCKRFEIFTHDHEEHTYSFYAIWDTYRDFKKYLRSDEFSMMLLAFKLLRKNPEIQYFKNPSGVGLYGLLRLRERKTKIN
ncbi:antibiotic biosynthesis monooxygenase family protein [Allomuricauda sp. d1]|uniref:putative quinol monooxygenase n=1 Tax=Allomuricauda sp. d1 TaxID=3136725 RepID=UPI0031CE78EA